MRVLHFIDSGSASRREFEAAAFDGGFDDRVMSCGLVRQCGETGIEQRVCIMGPADAAAHASRLGLAPDEHICPLLHKSRLAAPEVGRLVRAIRPDFVHWWGAAFSGGCFGRPGRAWRFESVAGLTPLGLPLWLTAPTALASSSVEEARARRFGFHRVVRVSSPVFPAPTVAPSRDGVRLLLLSNEGDARQFAFVYGVLRFEEVNVEALTGPTLRRRSSASDFLRRLRLTLPEERGLQDRASQLGQTDVALWMDKEPNPVPIRSALASGVPVVAPFNAAEFFPESMHGSCLAHNTTNAELSRVLLPLVSDSAIRDRAAEHARGAVEAVAENGAFVDAVLSAWHGRVAAGI